MKWRWLIGGTLFVVGGGCAALSTAAHIEARDSFFREREQLHESIDQHGADFAADERMLSALPAFARSTRARDAGPLLVKHIPFTGPANIAGNAPPPLPKALAAELDKAHHAKFPANAFAALSSSPSAAEAPDDAPERAAPPERAPSPAAPVPAAPSPLAASLAAVDLAWMRELHAFDHWELFASPPLAERPLSWHYRASPSRPDLERVAKARLLQGLVAYQGGDAGAVVAAGRDVEQLARLLLTTEEPTVERHAVDLWRLARRTWVHARNISGGAAVAGWEPLDMPTIDAAIRALEAWRGYTDSHVDSARVPVDLFTSPHYAAGRCAALQEHVLELVAFGPDPAGFLDDAFAWTARALQETERECRHTLARPAFSDREHQQQIVMGSDAFCDVDVEPGECIAVALASSLPGIADIVIEGNGGAPAAHFNNYRKSSSTPDAPPGGEPR